MKAHDLHNLSVLFRTNSSAIGHCTTLDAMKQTGLVFLYGLYRGTPSHYKRKRALLRNRIADALRAQAESEARA